METYFYETKPGVVNNIRIGYANESGEFLSNQEAKTGRPVVEIIINTGFFKPGRKFVEELAKLAVNTTQLKQA